MILMFYQNSNNQFAIFSKKNCPIHDFLIKFSPIQKEILIKKKQFCKSVYFKTTTTKQQQQQQTQQK